MSQDEKFIVMTMLYENKRHAMKNNNKLDWISIEYHVMNRIHGGDTVDNLKRFIINLRVYYN